MRRVQQASQRLAEETERRVLALWQRVESGDLNPQRFRLLAAAIIARANAQGVAVGDVGVTAEFMRQTRSPASPLGLAPDPVQVDQRRIGAGIDAVVNASLDSVDEAELAESRRLRLGRLARSEPLITVATAVQTGMQRRQAKGWVRVPDANPCPLCAAWADGATRPTSVRMARHVGCSCIQQPSFT